MRRKDYFYIRKEIHIFTANARRIKVRAVLGEGRSRRRLLSQNTAIYNIIAEACSAMRAKLASASVLNDDDVLGKAFFSASQARPIVQSCAVPFNRPLGTFLFLTDVKFMVSHPAAQCSV